MKKQHLIAKKNRVGLVNTITRVLKSSYPKYPVKCVPTYGDSYDRWVYHTKPESVTSVHIQWGGNDYFLMVSVEEDLLIHSVSKRGSIEWNYSEQVISEVTSIEVVYEALRLIANNFDDFSIETRKSNIKYYCNDCYQKLKTFDSAVEHKKKYENHCLIRKNI